MRFLRQFRQHWLGLKDALSSSLTIHPSSFTGGLGPRNDEPEHLRRGRLGEDAARQELVRAGLQFLLANFRSRHGEIDLILRDRDCLVFVEVKTRSSEEWTRPAAAVDARKRRLLSLTAEDYLRQLDSRRVKSRFDVVEVLLSQGAVSEIRHLINAFPSDNRPLRRR